VKIRNPFLRNAGQQNPMAHDRNWQYVNAAKNWRWAAAGLMATNLGLTGGLVSVAVRQQVVVPVVEVDELANVRVSLVGLGEVARDPLVRTILEHWLIDSRTVTQDRSANQRRLGRAHAMALKPAQQQIQTYYTAERYEEILKKGSVYPEKVRIARVSEKTWAIRWVEVIQHSDGRRVEETPWEATCEVELIPPTTKEELQRSPVGVWVSNLHWSAI
jgi:type IV secretory pathway TrbF-like protein